MIIYELWFQDATDEYDVKRRRSGLFSSLDKARDCLNQMFPEAVWQMRDEGLWWCEIAPDEIAYIHYQTLDNCL